MPTFRGKTNQKIDETYLRSLQDPPRRLTSRTFAVSKTHQKQGLHQKRWTRVGVRYPGASYYALNSTHRLKCAKGLYDMMARMYVCIKLGNQPSSINPQHIFHCTTCLSCRLAQRTYELSFSLQSPLPILSEQFVATHIAHSIFCQLCGGLCLYTKLFI